MFDAAFLAINSWMTGSFVLAAIGCFLWGTVSVLFSPCHLASIPLIIGYVGGQNRIIGGREAAGYAMLFTGGLFFSISIVGLVCMALGRLLGDIGPWWSVAVGLLLIYFGLDMLGIKTCRLPAGEWHKIRGKGYLGAFILGLAYGILSGSCTFGFIAPILAIITLQKQIVTGITLLLLFAMGHCFPIAVAGSSASLAQRMVASRSIKETSSWFKRTAGGMVVLLGVYFIVQPFAS